MSEQLKHIFDKSACLSRRQLKDYVSGLMTREECHAVEHHINTCFFCSEAIEGFAGHEEASMAMDGLTNSFLKDHFSLTNPQVHLNSMAPAASATPAIPSRRYRGKAKAQPLLRTSSIAAIVLLGLGLLWYAEFGRNNTGRTLAAGSVLSVQDKPAENAAPVKEETSSDQFGKPAAAQSLVASETAPQLPEGPEDVPQKPQPLLMTDQKAPEVARKEPAAQVKDEVKQTPPARKEVNGKEGPKTEPMVSRNVADAPALAAGAYQNNIDSYAPQASSSDKKAANDDGVKNDRMEQTASKASATDKSAEELYFDGKWSKALQAYRKEMNVGNTRHRQHAALMAARCHANLGQKAEAIQLLQAIVNEGGSQKKAAQRMLHDLSPDSGE